MQAAESDKGADHPAKIAQYLLKGWCLLNEYCPNGQNIPLVRSRKGELLCCGCDYYVPPPGEACAPCAPVPVPVPPLPAAPVPAASIASSNSESPCERGGRAVVITRLAVAGVEEAGSQGKAASFTPPTRGAGFPAAPDETLAPLPGDRLAAFGAAASGEKPRAMGSGPRARGESAAAMEGGVAPEQRPVVPVEDEGELETVVRGPDFRFRCAHFIGARGGQERITGGSYAVELRLAWSVVASGCVLDVGSVRQALRQECQRLAGRTLVPERSGALSVASAAFQTEVTCEGGARFNFPCDDCVLLPVAQVIPQELAVFLWQRVAESVSAAELRRCRVRWMEVHVADGLDAEAAFRRTVPSEA